jgi:archaellum component FlaC
MNYETSQPELAVVRAKGEIEDQLDHLDAVIERLMSRIDHLVEEVENVSRPTSHLGNNTPPADECPADSAVGRRIQVSRQTLEDLCENVDRCRDRLAL